MKMGKRVSINLNQGIDSFVRVIGYLRRREIEIIYVNMEKDHLGMRAEIEFNESLDERKIIAHLSKINDISITNIRGLN